MKNKQKNYLTSAAILAAGGILSKFLGMFFKIPLAATIGDYGLGLYSYAYPLYNTFLIISVAGLPIAISKMVSERASVGNYRGAYKVFYSALMILAVLGVACSLLMFFGARFFIDIFNWEPDAYWSIIALAAAPFFVAMISAVRGFFQGMQRMTFTSVSQILEQIGRVGLGIALAIYLTNRFDVAYGAAGGTFGATFGAIIAFAFLYLSFLIFRKKQSDLLKEQIVEEEESRGYLIKTLVILALPVALGGLVNTVMDLINSATIATILQNNGVSGEIATELFGQLEQKAQTLVNVPLVLGAALSASLVPSISASFVKNDKQKVIKKTSLAIRVAFLVSLPCAVGLSVLAEPIMKTVFSGEASGYTMLMSLAYVAVFTTGVFTMQGVLQGSGMFYKPLKNLAWGALIKLLLNIALISNPDIGIYGAVYTVHLLRRLLYSF